MILHLPSDNYHIFPPSHDRIYTQNTRKIGKMGSKLGEISTTFEVKLTKSARSVEIGHPEPGETAPHLVSSVGILEIGRFLSLFPEA